MVCLSDLFGLTILSIPFPLTEMWVVLFRNASSDSPRFGFWVLPRRKTSNVNFILLLSTNAMCKIAFKEAALFSATFRSVEQILEETTSGGTAPNAYVIGGCESSSDSQN